MIERTADSETSRVAPIRYVGAFLFGSALAAYAQKGCEYTIPAVLSVAQRIPNAEAEAMLGEMPWYALRLFTVLISALLGGFGAGYVARKHSGLLSSLVVAPYAFLGLIGRQTVNIDQPTPSGAEGFVWFNILSTVLYLGGGLFSGVVGGLLAHELHGIERRGTVFGIRWGHLFWILPFFGYPWFATLTLGLYFGLAIFVSGFYLLLHPSLWLDFTPWFFLTVTPILFAVMAMITGTGIKRFAATMHFSQGRRRFGRVLLYGWVFSTLGWMAGFIGVWMLHSMPRPARGDWKIGLALSLGGPAIAIVVSAIGWLMKRVSSGR